MKKQSRQEAKSKRSSVLEPKSASKSRAGTKSIAKGNASKPLDSYRRGYEAGYEEGNRMGEEQYGSYFNGTSIIIPSCESPAQLKNTVDHIIDHTELPYEIIVLDRSSSQEILEYLKARCGQLRYRVMEPGCSNAAAMNAGMMMAKGTSMLWLRSGTRLGPRYLQQLLERLDSKASIGGVLLSVASRNKKKKRSYDPQAEECTNNVLLKRNTWEQVGYMDERYTEGTYEYEDYFLRVRLQGYELPSVACVLPNPSDTHSALMKEEPADDLEDMRLLEIGDTDLDDVPVILQDEVRYQDKWHESHEWIHRVLVSGQEADPPRSSGELQVLGETAFFPQFTLVESVRGNQFWIEAGIRYPVKNYVQLPSVRISQLDLQRWPLGYPIDASAVKERWHIYFGARGTEGSQQRALCMTISGIDQSICIVENGIRRRVTSDEAIRAWGIHERPLTLITAREWDALPEGLPIIAPAVINEL